MQHSHRILPFFRILLLLSVLLSGWAITANASSLVYKNYIIRYDRGWDILCEPYVVQKGDWVLKIFRQKGEIAHQNFRDFLGIFQRLNPQVKDIDLVRPGQQIDIPLRKLEHGALSGQASGVVTIPFVTLTQVTDVIKRHSETYQIRRGDTLSRLIAQKYGSFGSASYREGMKLFQAANPQVTNIDRIYAGQKIYLPDPSIRQQSYYNAMYDEHGNLRQTIPQKGGTLQTPSTESGPNAAPSNSQPPAESARSIPVPAPTAAQPDAEQAPQKPLAEAAAAMHGKLLERGTYYLPRPGDKDFEIDLSRHPIMELPDGSKVTFTSDGRIMEMDAEKFQATWPGIKTVPVDDQSTAEEIIASVAQATKKKGEENTEVGFETQGFRVAVRAKWLLDETDGRHLCITPIAGPDQQTPDSFRRFLEQNGIILNEVLPDGKTAAVLDQEPHRHAVKHVLVLTPSNQKDFVKILARALGFTYTANTGITFPYAGIQVQAYADLVTAGNGRETLVDFGDLYGDALTAITATGLNIVQVTPDDGYGAIARKLLAALSMSYEAQPEFLVAPRPAAFNTTVTVSGILFAKSQNKRILLTGAALPSAVTDLLSSQGIDVVVW